MADDNKLTIMAELHYRDPGAALTWLAHAFGCQTRMVVADAQGRVMFAETGWGEVTVAIVPEDPNAKRSPQALNGANTQSVRVRGNIDVESHCARARGAGATIVQEPMQFFFGDRVYAVADLEGHIWSFAQRMPGAGGPPPQGWSVSFPAHATYPAR